MATVTQGRPDTEVQSLKDALDAYEAANPGADAALYRQNSASIRLRVIDRRFEGMTKSRRHAHVWDFLAARVPEDTLADVSLVLTVALRNCAIHLPTSNSSDRSRHAFDRRQPITSEFRATPCVNLADDPQKALKNGVGSSIGVPWLGSVQEAGARSAGHAVGNELSVTYDASHSVQTKSKYLFQKKYLRMARNGN